MVGELITKYIWLLQTLMDAGDDGLSFVEIKSRYRRRFSEEIIRRTFANYRDDVEEIFGIGIVCDRSTNRYSIDRGNRMAGESSASWLIDSFTVGAMLEKGKESLSGRIEVESVPSGHKFLTQIMEAMLQSQRLRISYCKYGNSTPESLTVLPYALKEDKRRWYLYAHCIERDALRCYALDRIREIDKLQEKFVFPEKFDLGELLATSFGTYIPREGEKGVTVEFRAKGVQARYIADLPIHHSQKLLKNEGEWTYFSIFVSAESSDLFFELRKYGPSLEVLSPQSVRERLRQDALAIVGMYNSKG